MGHGVDWLVDHVITVDPCRFICATAAVHHDPVIVVAVVRHPRHQSLDVDGPTTYSHAQGPVVVVPNHG